MLIKIKNKDTLIFDEFKLKCSIGKAGIKKNKIERVSFDRSGYKYHGKVKALADSMRENGVKI